MFSTSWVLCAHARARFICLHVCCILVCVHAWCLCNLSWPCLTSDRHGCTFREPNRWWLDHLLGVGAIRKQTGTPTCAALPQMSQRQMMHPLRVSKPSQCVAGTRLVRASRWHTQIHAASLAAALTSPGCGTSTSGTAFAILTSRCALNQCSSFFCSSLLYVCPSPKNSADKPAKVRASPQNMPGALRPLPRMRPSDAVTCHLRCSSAPH
jgi:hypothetical protein